MEMAWNFVVTQVYEPCCRQSYNIINDILPLVYFKFASQIVPDILLLTFVNMPNSHGL